MVHPISPAEISGSFGEYRNYGRYHPGLDYKTYNRTGLPVVAPYESTIEIVHMSATGYGNALFLRSSRGEIFTLAHLQDFTGKNAGLEAFRRAVELLRTEQTSVFTIPPWFHYRRGESLARSGESGIGAPHLHFEIRSQTEYINPLSVPGLAISDRTSPKILNLYLESGDEVYVYPCVLEKGEITGGPQKEIYRLEPDRPVLVSPDMRSLRFYIGLYDTMSARNKNGIYSLDIEAGDALSFHRDFSRIPMLQFSDAARSYHTGRTIVGTEYVYHLHDALTGGGIFSRGMLGSRSGGSESAQKAPFVFRITVKDSGGNSSILNFSASLSDRAAAGDGAHTAAGDIPYTRILPASSASLHRRNQNASLSLQFHPGSVITPGEIRIRNLEPSEMPAENTTGNAAAAWNYRSGGPAFLVDTHDLYYRTGADAAAEFPDTGDERTALYVFNPTAKRWRILARGLRTSGKILYRFPFRSMGVVAQLIDESPPRISRSLLWQDHADRLEYSREYVVQDRGMGIDREKFIVLINGLGAEHEWIEDRAALSITIPNSLIGLHGAVLSFQAADFGGNKSSWYFDYIEKPQPAN